tara:strand:+ start:7930 stop:8133 length:204 start_codon:yes stop_codon:yes gene_type:complete
MVPVLGHPHLGQQARSGDAFINHLGWYWCLDEGFSIRTGPLAADMAFHRKGTGDIVQLFTDVFADAS